jgi:hypothetical protein
MMLDDILISNQPIRIKSSSQGTAHRAEIHSDSDMILSDVSYFYERFSVV